MFQKINEISKSTDEHFRVRVGQYFVAYTTKSGNVGLELIPVASVVEKTLRGVFNFHEDRTRFDDKNVADNLADDLNGEVEHYIETFHHTIQKINDTKGDVENGK